MHDIICKTYDIKRSRRDIIQYHIKYTMLGGGGETGESDSSSESLSRVELSKAAARASRRLRKSRSQRR